jgi:hypothetical protein
VKVRIRPVFAIAPVVDGIINSPTNNNNNNQQQQPSPPQRARRSSVLNRPPTEVFGDWSEIELPRYAGRRLEVETSSATAAELMFVKDTDDEPPTDHDEIAGQESSPALASSGSVVECALGGQGWYRGLPPSLYTTVEEGFQRQFDHVLRAARRFKSLRPSTIPPLPDATYLVCFSPDPPPLQAASDGEPQPPPSRPAATSGGGGGPMYWRMPAREVGRLHMTLPRRMRLRSDNQGSSPQDAFAVSQQLSSSVLSQSQQQQQPQLPENVYLVFCIEAHPFSTRWETTNSVLLGHRMLIKAPLSVRRIRQDGLEIAPAGVSIEPSEPPTYSGVPLLLQPLMHEVISAHRRQLIDRVRFRATRSDGTSSSVVEVDLMAADDTLSAAVSGRRRGSLSKSGRALLLASRLASFSGSGAALSWRLPLKGFAGLVSAQVHVAQLGWSEWSEPPLLTATLPPLSLGIRRLTHTCVEVSWHRVIPDAIRDDDAANDAWSKLEMADVSTCSIVLAVTGAHTKQHDDATYNRHASTGEPTATRLWKRSVPLHSLAHPTTTFEALEPNTKYTLQLSESDARGWRATSTDVTFATLPHMRVEVLRQGSAYFMARIEQPVPLDCVPRALLQAPAAGHLQQLLSEPSLSSSHRSGSGAAASHHYQALITGMDLRTTRAGTTATIDRDRIVVTLLAPTLVLVQGLPSTPVDVRFGPSSRCRCPSMSPGTSNTSAPRRRR